MCIKEDDYAVVKNGILKLWKVIRSNDEIGVWNETYVIDLITNSLSCHHRKFYIGKNVARDFMDHNFVSQPAQFHCFFSRKDARQYIKTSWGSLFCRSHRRYRRKIIKVYANSEDVVLIGVDRRSCIRAISVSKMTIKSLKHQR